MASVQRMVNVLFVCLILCVSVAQSVYQNTSAGLSAVPHENITESEDDIDLSGNRLTTLHAREFSRYEGLRKLNLGRNILHTISPDAFCGTRLRLLWISMNRLTVFPNLTCVADTLRIVDARKNFITTIDFETVSVLTQLISLSIWGNPLTHHPNLTAVSSNAQNRALLRMSDLYPMAMQTICHFSQIILFGEDHTQTVPTFICAQTPTTLSLSLSLYDFSTTTDFSNLTSLSPSSINIADCILPTFPNFGDQLKIHLRQLAIRNSGLTTIFSRDLEDLSLEGLILDDNPLVTVPVEIFHVTESLSMDRTHLEPMEPEQITLALRWEDTNNLTSLSIENNFAFLKFMSPVAEVLCSREHELAISIKKVPVPCDCSIAWMAEAALRCPVSFLLNHLPCGLSNWTEVLDHLQCPANFVILTFKNGKVLIVTEEALVPNNVTLENIIVTGDRIWLLNSTSATNASSWVFSDGVFWACKDFVLADVEFHVRPFSYEFTMAGYNESAVTRLCEDSAHNVLMDGLPHSCMSLQPGVQYLSLFPDSSVPRSSGTVMVQTQGLPCSAAFHVMVSAACPHSCPRKHKCELINSVTLTSTPERHTCWFHCSCPDTLEHIDIRLVTILPDAYICETFWLQE